MGVKISKSNIKSYKGEKVVDLLINKVISNQSIVQLSLTVQLLMNFYLYFWLLLKQKEFHTLKTCLN